MECNAIEFAVGDDHVATITLNRPEALNSWNDEMAAEIAWAWQTVRDDNAVHAVRAATREAWPSGGPYRGRLFAFGFDAFRLMQALRHTGVGGTISVAGLTGRLSLDGQRHVRKLPTEAQRSPQGRSGS